MTNQPTLEQLSAHLLDIKKQEDALASIRKQTEEMIVSVAGDELQKQFEGAEYGCGTATLNPVGYKIKVVIGKKVTWEQDGLKQVAEQLVSAGQDPAEYIKAKYDVSETAYKNWPSSLQAMFQPHRTVEPSKPKITVEAV